MVFACQRDSYLKEFRSRVVECSGSLVTVKVPGTQQPVQGYEVVLEDSVLFPEGGGQPSDQGFLENVRVVYAFRRGDQPVCIVDEPFEIGCEVRQVLDWERRYDHMQQHSGQHLLSALGEKFFSCSTTSWWLGEETSYIEIDSTGLEQRDIDRWEELANEKIRAGLAVSVSVHDRNDPSLSKAHTRGLPEDFCGPVRIVAIEGIDSNLCCGTHVRNLQELQMVKLLNIEKGKKNKMNLNFLVGGRVLRYLAKAVRREDCLTSILKNGPNYHVDLVENLQNSQKLLNKNLRSVLRDLAVLEAQKFLALPSRPKYYSVHRKEGDLDFMRVFLNEVGSQETLLFLTVGNDEGQMMLFGQPDVVSQLGPELCKILGGKGAGKGPKYQAKVTQLCNRDEAIQCINNFMNKV